MMPVRRLLSTLLLAPAAVLLPRVVTAQCVVQTTSTEARLMAFFAVPLAFSGAVQPDQLRPGQWRVSVDAALMPSADPSLRPTTCYSAAKGESTNLASIFPRPRVAVGLPFDLEAEVSWVPPLQVKDAKANLVGLALAWTRRVAILAGASVILQARAHTLIGSVEGPITCNVDALQANNTLPCYGKTISNDRFTPNVSGGELALAFDAGEYAVFGSVGMNSMDPEFRVDFANGAGYVTTPSVDNTQIKFAERLNRTALSAGATWRIFRGLDLTGQIYTSLEDTSISRIIFTYHTR